MTTETTGSFDPNDSLNEVIAEIERALDAGEAVVPEEWAARHPGFKEQLLEYFAGDEVVRRLAESVRGVLLPGPQPRRVRYFGDYELIEQIGIGGMGIVYRARQMSLNRDVALKMVLAGSFCSDDALSRFRREAKVAATLDHPHIVEIFEVGQHDGLDFFSMRLVKGPSLAGELTHHGPALAPPSSSGAATTDSGPRLSRFGRQPRLAAQLLAVVARAVHHAHQHGIIHRDLKPANILLAEASQGPEGAASPPGTTHAPLHPFPIVTDFGLAKLLDQPDESLSYSGQVLGTPPYMAPEQARGDKQAVTIMADVYGLGATLYAMLAGRPPFKADSREEVLRQVREDDPAPIRPINPAVDRDLEAIVFKCLQKSPSLRYGTAEGLALDLESWLSGRPIVARPILWTERIMKWIRRRPAAAALIGTGHTVARGPVGRRCVVQYAAPSRAHRREDATQSGRTT